MNDQYANFQYWQLLRRRGVEDNGEYYNCYNEECAMPCTWNIAVVVQGYQTLNLMDISAVSNTSTKIWHATEISAMVTKCVGSLYHHTG